MSKTYYEVLGYKSHEDYDCYDYEVLGLYNVTSMAEAMRIGKQRLSKKFPVIKIQSDDREEIEVLEYRLQSIDFIKEA